MAQTTREHNDLSAAIAAVVRAERAAAGLSRDDVCTRSGIPTSTYRRIETAERVATVAQLAQVAPVFGLRPSMLVARAELRISTGQPVVVPATTGSDGIPDSARVADVEVALAMMDQGQPEGVGVAGPDDT